MRLIKKDAGTSANGGDDEAMRQYPAWHGCCCGEGEDCPGFVSLPLLEREKSVMCFLVG